MAKRKTKRKASRKRKPAKRRKTSKRKKATRRKPAPDVQVEVTVETKPARKKGPRRKLIEELQDCILRLEEIKERLGNSVSIHGGGWCMRGMRPVIVAGLCAGIDRVIRGTIIEDDCEVDFEDVIRALKSG